MRSSHGAWRTRVRTMRWMPPDPWEKGHAAMQIPQSVPTCRHHA